MDEWPCHVCGDLRPDDKISVLSRQEVLEGGVQVTTNVRFCNDRPACVEGCQAVDFLPNMKRAT